MYPIMSQIVPTIRSEITYTVAHPKIALKRGFALTLATAAAVGGYHYSKVVSKVFTDTIQFCFAPQESSFRMMSYLPWSKSKVESSCQLEVAKLALLVTSGIALAVVCKVLCAKEKSITFAETTATAPLAPHVPSTPSPRVQDEASQESLTASGKPFSRRNRVNSKTLIEKDWEKVPPRPPSGAFSEPPVTDTE